MHDGRIPGPPRSLSRHACKCTGELASLSSAAAAPSGRQSSDRVSGAAQAASRSRRSGSLCRRSRPATALSTTAAPSTSGTRRSGTTGIGASSQGSGSERFELPNHRRVPGGAQAPARRFNLICTVGTARRAMQARTSAAALPPVRDSRRPAGAHATPLPRSRAVQRGQRLHPRAGGRGCQAAGRAHHPPAPERGHQGPAAVPGCA